MAKKNGHSEAWPTTMKRSAREVWLAGLGALAMAGEEGNNLFKQLVKRGESMDKATRTRVIRLKSRASDLKDDVNAAFGRIAMPIDAGMTKTLHRLGVPTRREILALTKRVEDLTRAVQKSRHTRAGAGAHHSRKHAAAAN